jgi:uroporphyrinogen decarboxylase
VNAMDFVCRATEKEISARCKNILEKTKAKGGNALCTGNSVPTYVPDENYFAMINSTGYTNWGK